MRDRTIMWGQMQSIGAWTLFKLIDILSDSANTFAMFGHGLETNKQAACMVLTKWFKHSSKHSNETVDKERLAWQVIRDRQSVILTPCTRRCPECQSTVCPNWTNGHFSSSHNYCEVQFWSLYFVIKLSLRDSWGYGMCGNETKPRMLVSPGVYKHCNVPRDPSVWWSGIRRYEWGKWEKNFVVFIVF